MGRAQNSNEPLGRNDRPPDTPQEQRLLSPPWKGRLLAVVAALLWSMSAFFAKAPTFLEWPEEIRGSLYAFWRSLFAAAVLVLFVRQVRWSWKLIPTTMIFAVMNMAYLNSLVYCEATLAIWLQYSAPIWVLFGSWWLFKERPVRKDWWLLAFAVLGVLIIIWNQLEGASAFGVQLGLLSGLTFASVVLTLRWCRELNAAWIIFLNHFVTALCFLPVLIHHGVYPNTEQSLYLLAFGGLQMGIPYVLFANAVRMIPNNEASSLTLLEPILVPLWVWVAWSNLPDYQPPEITTIIGGGLILTGLVIRFWPLKKSEQVLAAQGKL